MITTLAIKNYALIEDVHVDFNSGMTVITGETGAGKSILLGALALILGKRADISSVKDASKKCIIEAEFDVTGYNLQSIYSENELDYEATTIVRREILPSGKSRAFVNDTPVTLIQLQALGFHLVDVHSQHETLTLSSEDFQLEVIDALAGNEETLNVYATQLKTYKSALETLSELKNKQETASKELEYHTFLYTELEALSLEKIDQQALEETYETLNNTEEIQESLSKINQLFSEEEIGTLQTAKEARLLLGNLRKFSADFDSYWTRLDSSIIELEDIFEGIEASFSSIEANPQRLFEVNELLQALYKLQQKHKVATVAELVEIQTELASKIDTTAGLDSRIGALEKEIVSLKETTLETASVLHKKRIEVIPVLKEKLEHILSELGLPNAQFNFVMKVSQKFRSIGTDTLELLFTANKGLAFGTLKKVASGGELSRIMLAIKAILAQYKKLPTLIFDEIDTGVSGAIAHKMAEIMSTMGTSMQLVSITHLPQIAARGEHHLKVYKEDAEQVTQTHLKLLNEEERIVEIAQMIGGEGLTDSAITHAKELLN